MRTVAQDGHGLAELVDLGEMVRDVEERDASRLKVVDAPEERVMLARLELRRRLVKDDEAAAARERAADLDELSLFDGEAGRLGRDREVDAIFVEKRVGAPSHGAPAEEPAAF